MSKPPHYVDLDRRYREIDWVSEFQRLWAIFNHWLSAHVGQPQDRKCIEQFKLEPKLADWVNRRVSATQYPRPTRLEDGYGGSFPQFAANNELSSLFRSVITSPTLAARVSHEWRSGSEPRVRNTCAITLTEDQFLLAYRAHAQVLEEGIADFNLTLHQTLPILGIYATGCCFYRGAAVQVQIPSDLRYAHRFLDLIRASATLSELVHLAEAMFPTSLQADLLETLYNVRNVAMHGSLDFLDINDNDAARAGFDALDSLIRDIRDTW